MNPTPAQPKIFHITHVDNLPSIIAAGRLWSDAERIRQGLACSLVGMSEIKRRRLEELPVPCHPGTLVGHYVPFYFCPRSIMLYVLHKGNHAELAYQGGQRPIVHLQADLYDTVALANRRGVAWAFSTRNAGARYAPFFSSLEALGEVSWTAVEASDFRSSEVKEGKQAEFLTFGSFPWALVEKVGVIDNAVLAQATSAIALATHQPPVAVEPGWYF